MLGALPRAGAADCDSRKFSGAFASMSPPVHIGPASHLVAGRESRCYGVFTSRPPYGQSFAACTPQSERVHARTMTTTLGAGLGEIRIP
jgi:hypothetical protein